MSESRQADEPLSQRQEQLDRHIASKVDGLLRGLHDQIGERVRSVSDELLNWLEQHAPEIPGSFLGDFDIASLVKPQAEPEPTPQSSTETLLAAVSRIDGETGQAEVLSALLQEASAFASRTAFFLIRQDQVRGWASHGFSDEDRAQSVQASIGQAPWSNMLDASATIVVDEAASASLAEQLGGGAAAAGILVPFVIRGQISAAFYADQEDGGALDSSSLQLLVHSACMALETVAVSPGRSATLERHGELPQAVPSGLLAATAAAAVAASAAAVSAHEEAQSDEADISEDDQAAALVEEADSELEPASYVEEEVEEGAGNVEVSQDLEASGDDVATEGEVDAAAEDDVEAEDAQAPAPFVAEPEPVMAYDGSAQAIVDAEAETIVTEPEDSDFEEGDSEASHAAELEPEDPGAEESGLADSAPSHEVSAEEALQSEDTQSEPAAAEPWAEASDEVAATPEPAVEEAPEVVDEAAPDEDSFGVDDDYLPTEDEIAREAEPEPELEDTNIWELEEDEEEDDEEPTHVGRMVRATEETPRAATVPVPEPEASTPDAAIGQETVRIDLASIQQHPEASLPQAVVPAAPTPPAPEPVAPPEPLPADSATDEGDDGDETSPTMHAIPSPAGFAGPASAPPAPSSFTAPPSSFAEPPAAEPPAPTPPTSFAAPATTEVTPPPPAPASSGTQVAPPPDLDGPGLAFATPAPAAADSLGEADAALHEEARRLARLLVSEIKLYNEEIIEEGRRSGNIYERLKDDIDRSRQMYEERIDPRLADREDYFYQELVQRLASGDRNLLGM